MTESAWAIFGAVALAHALGVMSPGPDFAVVIRQSLAHGRTAGIWTAAGIGSGILFHVSYGLFGLHWLTRQWPWLMTVIAVAGAGFLIWMGLRALRAGPATDPAGLPPTAAAPPRWHGPYWIGLATNVLNPKATLFFVALFTTVVSGPMPPLLIGLLAIWLPLATFGWFATLALMLSHSGLRRILQAHAWQIDRIMGAILILLGGLTLLRSFG